MAKHNSKKQKNYELTTKKSLVGSTPDFVLLSQNADNFLIIAVNIENGQNWWVL